MTAARANASSPVVVLASQSARRLELLQQLGLQVRCRPVQADERMHRSESALALVERLARLKAEMCRKLLAADEGAEANTDHVILGADTIVEIDGTILGKPHDAAHCVGMLQSLSEREHQVHTGVCVVQSETREARSVCVSTTVRFARISADTAQRYWMTGEPADKAGGYAIQGRGGQFVVHLSGSYSNVVGLPLFETSTLLSQAGIHCL